jgi:hypothetical protein
LAHPNCHKTRPSNGCRFRGQLAAPLTPSLSFAAKFDHSDDPLPAHLQAARKRKIKKTKVAEQKKVLQAGSLAAIVAARFFGDNRGYQNRLTEMMTLN